jgi:hypothetical protein
MDQADIEYLAATLAAELDMPTLRDRFAMASMQGLLASASDVAGRPDDLAAMAYEQADAMIAAREAGERGD